MLEEIDAWAPDSIWCLGDTVGYGPAPNGCCELVSQRADVCLIGNHDLVALGTLDVEDFNGDAAAAALWTRKELEERGRSYLSALESSAVVDGAELFHASPRDPVWEYVLSAETAYLSLLMTKAPLVLVGHSHVALAIGLDESAIRGGLAPADTGVDLGGRWLLNPGSVGQPRDGDARAAWLELDTDEDYARFHRVAYPIERTQARMREIGLPESLAERLAHGI